MQNKLHKLKQSAKLKLLVKKLINWKNKNFIINICEIGFIAFYINFKYSENILFLLSLYKLNYKLKDYKRE